jgi:hypothetical protein
LTVQEVIIDFSQYADNLGATYLEQRMNESIQYRSGSVIKEIQKRRYRVGLTYNIEYIHFVIGGAKTNYTHLNRPNEKMFFGCIWKIVDISYGTGGYSTFINSFTVQYEGTNKRIDFFAGDPIEVIEKKRKCVFVIDDRK